MTDVGGTFMCKPSPAVSVVIPVRNCGDALRLCLESIKDQTLEDFEVIVVDNGSTDSSANIVREFASADDRFILKESLTGSAGSSRSFGVDCSRGEYISFIDGDDRIAPDFLEKLYNAALDSGADIAVCGFCYHFLNTGKTEKASPPPDRLFSRDEALHCLLKDRDMRFYLWNKLWKRSLFTDNNIRIPDMYYEDAVSSTALFCCAKSVVSLSYCGYYYSRAFSRYKEVAMPPKRANDYVNTIPMIRLILEEHGCYKKFRKSFRIHIFHVYFALPSVVRQSSPDNKRSDRENIRAARAKIRLCCKVNYDKLKRFDLSKPVIE